MKKLKNMGVGKKLLVLCFISTILCMTFSQITYADEDDKRNHVDVQNKQTGSANISIDGYYDDWDDKPMSILTWNSNNGEAHHDVSMIKDDSNIYIYVKMHQHYQSPIPIDAIYLTINGQECQVFLRYANAQNRVDWSHNIDFSQNGTYTGLHPFTYYPDNSLGDAAVTVSKGNPNDRLEMRINIRDLEQVMNLKEGTVNSGSTISLRMPNVGGGTVELMGTSSGPVIGILLCVGTVIAALWFKGKRTRLAR